MIYSRGCQVCLYFAFLVVLVAGGESRAGEEARAGEEDDSDADEPGWELEAKTSVGWQSNLFEVDPSREARTGDGFVGSSIETTFPLNGGDGDLRGRFMGAEKRYFQEDQLDDYELKPGLCWQAFDGEDVNLVLDIEVSRFLERIYDESQPIPNRSQPGWGAGAGWKFESSMTDKLDFNWEGKGCYQWFDQVSQDNLTVGTALELVYAKNDRTEWTFGTRWEFQDYAVRPPETEAPGHPVGLETLEGHLSSAIEYKLGGGVITEIGCAVGPRFDLTTGYYDSDSLNVHWEWRWETGHWKLRASAEVEWTKYSERPANISKPNHELTSQVLVFEPGVEYALTKDLSIFGETSLRVRDTNSSAAGDDITLNDFSDTSVKIGVHYSF
ncbi:MAG: hypothetical protein ABI073_12455 [Luteolibacter sp.]